jgi:2-oxoglutarate ferredoxin oxidoreductase subunit beta
MGHLIHTFRRNPSFTYLVMNNGIYGLTKGQDSPTRDGTQNIDSVLLGLSVLETTFIARGFTRWADQLHRLTVAALAHARAGRGFAFLEVLSPCVTYNDTYPQWEAQLHDLDTDDTYDPSDRANAFGRAINLQAEGRIPVGLIYRSEPSAVSPDLPNPSTADLRPASHLADYRRLLHSYQL